MTRRSLLVSALILALLWQLAAWGLRSSILPGPVEVLTIFVNELGKGLWVHMLASGYRVIVAMLLAVLLAAPVGLAVGQSRRWDRLISPSIYLTYPVPKIVLLPVVLLLLGLGDPSKIFMIWLILFYQVILVVRDASRSVRPELVESVYSLGARRLQLLRHVYFPACLPAILTALRVSAGTAIAVLFFTESFATQSGLGYYILVEGWGRLAYGRMYAGVLAMSVLGLIIYVVLDQLERRACAWQNAELSGDM
ncbi:MAG: ABC transporter permease subunit [Chloroflexota bacterium]|nr:MAG: ABC transporter permease subunit [Chloroflexota bacterium]